MGSRYWIYIFWTILARTWYHDAIQLWMVVIIEHSYKIHKQRWMLRFKLSVDFSQSDGHPFNGTISLLKINKIVWNGFSYRVRDVLCAAIKVAVKSVKSIFTKSQIQKNANLKEIVSVKVTFYWGHDFWRNHRPIYCSMCFIQITSANDCNCIVQVPRTKKLKLKLKWQICATFV